MTTGGPVPILPNRARPPGGSPVPGRPAVVEREVLRCTGGVAVRFDVETRASPEQVRRALTDFGAQRLTTWRRSLDPRTYEVREQGETWAVARESTPRSPFWVVLRYDWSDPDVVRWTTVESSYGGGGDGEVRVVPRGDGGSRVHVEYDHTEPTRQRLLLRLVHVGLLGRLVGRLWTAALDDLAASEARGHDLS